MRLMMLAALFARSGHLVVFGPRAAEGGRPFRVRLGAVYYLFTAAGPVIINPRGFTQSP